MNSSAVSSLKATRYRRTLLILFALVFFVSVNLLIDISAKGLVTHVEVVSTSNQKIADKVVKTAMSWRFQPAIGPAGQPIAMQIPFELSLGNKLN